jgi:hypothetical protein
MTSPPLQYGFSVTREARHGALISIRRLAKFGDGSVVIRNRDIQTPQVVEEMTDRERLCQSTVDQHHEAKLELFVLDQVGPWPGCGPNVPATRQDGCGGTP